MRRRSKSSTFFMRFQNRRIMIINIGIIMSTESIIGIIASVITIIGAPFAFYKFVTPWIKKYFKYPYAEVFDQLTKKDLLDENRRKFLRKLNGSPYFKGRIREDYIQTFSLGKRRREEVLLDICDSNNIEPTHDICKEILGYDSDSLRKKYDTKRQIKKENSTPTPIEPTIMKEPEEKPALVIGEQTVYLSKLLKTRYPETCDRLVKILEKHKVNYRFLEGTKDIWCRDYMPVQTKSGKLVQFKYDPSYLKGSKELEDSRSDVKEVCRANGFKPQFSDINLDGGNVLICGDRAIISDRILSENQNKRRDELVSELKKLLECKDIIIIPAENDDMTGHADGMVRFVNQDTILGNNREKEYKYWREGMDKIIAENNLKYIDVPFFEVKDRKHPDSAIGIYVNYLEVNKLIVVPVFGREEDKQALDIIKQAFPDRVVETIDYNDVATEGGLVNCTTWVVCK